MANTAPKICLIRHGETLWTQSGQHTGRTDISLTEEGEKQAKQLGHLLKNIHFQATFTSPLKRAKETCILAGLYSQTSVDENLVEFDYGAYEGKTSKEIKQIDPHWSLFLHGAPKGESLADVGERAYRFLGKVCRFSGPIAVFSHGHVLRVLCARYLDLAPSYGKFFVLSPAFLSILGIEHNKPAILEWNNTSHLPLNN